MKLIIDIPEEDYKKINNEKNFIDLSCNIAYVIINGIPLNDVLDKIKNEIYAIRTIIKNRHLAYIYILKIIDKHR